MYGERLDVTVHIAIPSSMTVLRGIQAVLLDIDGTLFSSEDMLLDVYHKAMVDFRNRHGRPESLPDLSAIMAQIGQPVKKIFENLLPELEQSDREEIAAQILDDLVMRIESGQGVHYDGVAETLKKLRDAGFRIFSASNGRKAYVEAILKAAGIHHLFEAVPAIDNVRIFNKNDLVACTLRDYRLKPRQCIIVGDRSTDRDAGKANGVAFVATLYGHHGSPDEHEGAVAKIETFSELLTLLGVE
jgi:phosphoglycolate phosphatase